MSNENKRTRRTTRYRKRAEEIREVAATVRDNEARVSLLRLAISYESMAANLDKIERRIFAPTKH